MSGDALDGRGVADAVRVLRGRRISTLTGAGISTDSGIPDYRGQGAPVRTPMSFERFRGEELARKRYWAGSHLGWRRFRGAEPNPGHLALAELERAGVVNGVITQNVDDLHLRAGSARVVELHGSMRSVSCLSCGQRYAREAIAGLLTALNPWLETVTGAELAPDGDVAIADVERMVVPVCERCRGMLRPDVVFFGELVPQRRFAHAAALAARSEALLVAGSSLAVNSGIRIVEIARRRRIPIIVVNRGPTKADARAAVRIEGGTSQVLAEIRDQLLA